MRRSILLTLTLAMLASCQWDAVMWDTCTASPTGDPTGTDGTYILVCDDGIWSPLMTIEEWSAIRDGRDVSIKPLPTRPSPTTTAATGTTTTTTTTTPDPYTLVDLSGTSGTVNDGCANCASAFRSFTDPNGHTLLAGFSISDTGQASDGGYSFKAVTYFTDEGMTCRYPIDAARGRAVIDSTTYRMDIDDDAPSGITTNYDLPGPWNVETNDYPTIHSESIRINYDAPVCS